MRSSDWSSDVLFRSPAELLAGASARSVIEELEKGYDVLLIDSPPTLGLADAVDIGALAEGSVFVMEEAKNQDRKSVEKGKSVTVRGDLDGRGTLKKK